MKFSRQWAMPSADTFSVAPIRDFVKRYVVGTVVDPFARNSDLATEYSNDLNPKTSAKFHMQADEFLSLIAGKGVIADTIILDPPYSPRQISVCYQESGLKVGMIDTQNALLYKSVRQEARRLCKQGTVVLSFGWNSTGMGEGFELEEIMLVCHGGAHNDTICIAERMTQEQIGLF